MVEFTDDDLQGSRFRRVDLSGSRWHGVMFQNVKITDAWINNLDISGLIGTLTVNGVDVSTFVRTELEKRHPELRMFRATDVDGLRAAWATIDERAQATVERARGLSDAALTNQSTASSRFFRRCAISCSQRIDGSRDRYSPIAITFIRSATRTTGPPRMRSRALTSTRGHRSMRSSISAASGWSASLVY
jgi:hypothetical protein